MKVYDVNNCMYYTKHTKYKVLGDTKLTNQGYEQEIFFLDGVLLFLIKLFNSKEKDLVFCFDDTKDINIRKEIYPLYKSNRKGKNKIYRDYVITQCYILQKILNQLGTFALSFKGYEADDIISNLAQYNKVDSIFTTDSDLFFWKSKGINIYTNINEETKIELKPNHNILYKILLGDKSDNIPPLCNKARAEEIINTVKHSMDKEEMLINLLYSNNLQGVNTKDLKRNIELVYPLDIDFNFETYHPVYYDENELLLSYIKTIKYSDNNSPLYNTIVKWCKESVNNENENMDNSYTINFDDNWMP